jgi:hypothetical protein
VFSKQQRPIKLWNELVLQCNISHSTTQLSTKMEEISKSLKAKLAMGKYSQWAKDIDEETFVALCWFVGEFAVRHTSPGCMRAENFSKTRYGAGLKGIVEIYTGKTFDGIESIRDYLRKNTLPFEELILNPAPFEYAAYTISYKQNACFSLVSPNQKRAVYLESYQGQVGFYADDYNRKNLYLDMMPLGEIIGKEVSVDFVMLWSRDSHNAALFINSEPYAVFDFQKKRGYCKKQILPPKDGDTSFQWDDSCLDAFKKSNEKI